MKKLSIFVMLVVLWMPCPAHAQNSTINRVGAGFDGSDHVIQLNFPESWDGRGFVIVWKTLRGQFTRGAYAREGLHAYEMRDMPEWNHHVEMMGISAADISGQAIVPAFSDELDMWMAPEPVTIATVNFISGHTLFGWSWTLYLLAAIPLLAVAFVVIGKKPIASALVLGFLVAWGAMDLRAVYDHGMVVSRTSRYIVGHGGVFPLSGTKVFADFASRIMGPATWSDDGIGLTNGDYIRYRFADRPYASPASERVPQYRITLDPRDDPPAFQYGGYYLVKGKPR